MSSYLSQNREFQKNGKKIQKIEKKPLWLLFEPKYVGKGRESVKKKVIPMSSYPIQEIEFQKNSKKSQKIKKHQNNFPSSQNKTGKAEK